MAPVGLDQGEMDARRPDFDGQAGESGAGAEIYDGGGDGGVGQKQASGKEGFTEVAADDLFWFADRGKVNAGVPAKQNIGVCRYTLQLAGRKRAGRKQKRLQQLGDAGGIHAGDCKV